MKKKLMIDDEEKEHDDDDDDSEIGRDKKEREREREGGGLMDMQMPQQIYMYISISHAPYLTSTMDKKSHLAKQIESGARHVASEPILESEGFEVYMPPHPQKVCQSLALTAIQ